MRGDFLHGNLATTFMHKIVLDIVEVVVPLGVCGRITLCTTDVTHPKVFSNLERIAA